MRNEGCGQTELAAILKGQEGCYPGARTICLGVAVTSAFSCSGISEPVAITLSLDEVRLKVL